MGYKWINLTEYDLTDHSTPLYGIRVRQIGGFSDYCVFVSEKQGLDCNNKTWDGGTTPELGYYSYHRFNLWYNTDFHDRINGVDVNIPWNQLEEVTIEGVVWKTYDYSQPPLYWGGFIQPSNWTSSELAYIQLKVKDPFEPSKSVFNFSSTGGLESFTIEATTGWTATTASDWVSLSQTTGTTGGTLTLTCSPNASDSARTATITFIDANSDTFDITVNQKKKGILVPKAKIRKGALIVSKEYWNGSNEPTQPNDEIWYDATSKLDEVTDIYLSGLHTNAFNTTIQSHSFSDGKGIIKFNADVTLVGDYAFYSCQNMTKISLPNLVTSIAVNSFDNCRNLSQINIPNSVTSINYNAFRNCYSLTSITIPNSVTLIGVAAFKNCSGLTSITISSSVASIMGNAFENCRSLTTITVPASVTSIGAKAFYNCTGLTEVICNPINPPSLSTQAFDNNASGRKIKVPSGSVDTYKEASRWSTYADDIISQ